MIKPEIKFNLVSMRHPGNKKEYLRGRITDREVLDLEQVITYARERGLVRGQLHETMGEFNGILDAIRQLALAGKWVRLGDWMCIHEELTGAVDEETRLPGSGNALHVVIKALGEFKAKVSDVGWKRNKVDARCVLVDSITSVGGDGRDGVLTRGKDIRVTGRNLQFDRALGDNVTCEYRALEFAHGISDMSPEESDVSHMRFKWTTSLDEALRSAPVRLSFYLHGGVKGAARQRVFRQVKIVDA